MLEQGNHVLFDDNTFLVKVFDDKVVIFAVNVDNDGLDGGVALDEHACQTGRLVSSPLLDEEAWRGILLMARGMMVVLLRVCVYATGAGSEARGQRAEEVPAGVNRRGSSWRCMERRECLLVAAAMERMGGKVWTIGDEDATVTKMASAFEGES